jgi:hypothetical protein
MRNNSTHFREVGGREEEKQIGQRYCNLGLGAVAEGLQSASPEKKEVHLRSLHLAKIS